MKNFYCPFCMEKFNSRSFLNNIHISQCNKREEYFNKILDPVEMEDIYKRIHGNAEIQDVDWMRFKGKVLKDG